MRIGNVRAGFVNYKKPGIFFITMNKREEIPYFSRIIFNPNEAIVGKAYRPNYYDLGYVIFNAIRNIKEIIPGGKIHQYVIMPDHIHFILEITEELESFLWEYIEDFKNKIFREAFNKNLIPVNVGTIFETGFNDLFLKHSIKLDNLYSYIRKNPYRLWIRFKNPEFFRRINERRLGGVECSLYGNLNLLDNPFKFSVVIHKRYSDKERSEKFNLWRYGYKNGGVLVGAFIENREQEIFNEAKEAGAKIILFSNENYGKREKPSDKLMKLCENGNLLIISPNFVSIKEETLLSFGRKELLRDIDLASSRLSREKCLIMNALTERICAY